MPLDAKQKKEIINYYPFPIAYVYQDLVCSQSKLNHTHQTREISLKLLHSLLRNSSVLLRTLGIFLVCDYLHSRNRLSNPRVNKILLENISQPTELGWFKINKTLLEHFASREKKENKAINKIPELLQLLAPTIQLENPPPTSFPSTISHKKKYTWLEIMKFFNKLHKHLRYGEYRLNPPDKETLGFYVVLLEHLLAKCNFLTKYGIYVLVSKDDRKTRGFLCQGTKSRPVGIRGISVEKWHLLKGKPFISPYGGHKQHISLYPFMVPFLQKYKDRTGFSDLLFYEQTQVEALNFFGYRLNKLIPHKQCAVGALAFIQKELRWLKANTNKLTGQMNPIPDFQELVNFHSVNFVGRTYFFKSLFAYIQNHNASWLILRGQTGVGKTATLIFLYNCIKSSSLKKILPDSLSHLSVCFAWYFCSKQERDHPIVIIKAIYGQILQKIFSQEELPIALRLQKLPGNLEDLKNSFAELLQITSEQILLPNQTKLVIVIDALDEIDPALASEVFSAFSQCALENIIFLASVNSWEESQKLVPFEIFDKKIDLPNFSLLKEFSDKELTQWLELEKHGEFLDTCEAFETTTPLYLKMLFDYEQINNKKISPFSIFPQKIHNFLQLVWESLPDKYDFLAYKIIAVLAFIKEYATDEMLCEILSCQLEAVIETRYQINYLLLHEGKRFALLHKSISDFVQNQLAPRDKMDIYSKLAVFYDCLIDDKRDYKNITNSGFLHLSYHYFQQQNLEKLFAIAVDNQFKEEKLKRFKSYQVYLDDIKYALRASFQNKLYEDLLVFSYRYCHLVFEARRGIAHIFRYAEHGDYEIALEKARTLRDSEDLFKSLLIILWYAIDNENYKEASPILEEMERIPDDQVEYIAAGLTPLVIEILQKAKRAGIENIGGILKKHGLRGLQAVEHLLELSNKIRFTYEQKQHFLSALFFAVQTSLTPQQLSQAISAIAPELQKMGTSFLEAWDFLIELTASLELPTKFEKLCEISQALISLEQKDYVKDIVEMILPQIEELEEVEVLTQVKLARLIIFSGNIDKAKYYLEKAFIVIVSETSLSQKCKLALAILPDMKEIGDYENTKIYWKRLCSIAKNKKQNTHQMKLCAEVVVALAHIQKWDIAFKLLEQTISSYKTEVRTATLSELSLQLSGKKTSPYLEALLEYVRSLSANKERLKILTNIAKGFLHLKISPHNPVWKKYLSVCDHLKDTGGDEEKNEILSFVASQFAREKYIEQAYKIINKLSSPQHRAVPLADVAIEQVEAGINIALQTAEEITDAIQAYRAFAAIAKNIGENISHWEKLISIMLRIPHLEGDTEEIEYLSTIILHLSLSFSLEEGKSFWQDIFFVVEKISSHQGQMQIIDKILALIKNVGVYERTTHCWPFIIGIVTDFESSSLQAQAYTNIAEILADLGQFKEAQNFLQQALQYAEEEETAQAIAAMSKTASVYRELGNEKRCMDIFERILYKSGIFTNKRMEDFSPYQFIVDLFSLGLEDLGRTLVEKMLFHSVDIGDEVPQPHILVEVAELALDAGRRDWVRSLFFQILPILSRETYSFVYTQAMELLEKMDAPKDLWQQAQAILLNLSQISAQERYLEVFASALSKNTTYAHSKNLWKKLLTDACYIGGPLESAKCIARVGKYLLQIASWEEFQEHFEYIMKSFSKLNTEYDKVELLEITCEIFLADSNFSELKAEWKKLIEIPTPWNREDCRSRAYISFSMVLVNKGKQNPELFISAEKFLNKVSKPQQSCEGYFLIAKNYYDLQMEKEAKKFVKKTLEKGKKLGSFFYNQILPKLVQRLLDEKDYRYSMELTKDITDISKKIKLQLDIVEKMPAKEAKLLFSKTLETISQMDSQYGEQMKMYALAAQISNKHLLHNSQEIFEKALASWNDITTINYQKESIVFVIPILQELGDYHQMQDKWQMILQFAQKISQETYRAWTLQKIAEAWIEANQLEQALKILEFVSLRKVKLRILEDYALQMGKLNKGEEIFRMFAILTPEEKKLLIYKLAEGLYLNNHLESLFLLLVKFPDDFHLNCFVTLKILKIGLTIHGKECFQKWFSKIAPKWGMDHGPWIDYRRSTTSESKV